MTPLQEQIVQRFPRLYHYGPMGNRRRMEQFQAVLSTDMIRLLANVLVNNPERRMSSEPIDTNFGEFLLNDQEALQYGHVKDPDSLPRGEFINLIDQFAFFWPGDETRPIQMGRNFAGRYLEEPGSQLLRVSVSTRAFFEANNPVRIMVSECNSGAPRSHPKLIVYRGYNTFCPVLSYQGDVPDIKEIVAIGYGRLVEPVITVIDKEEDA